MGNALNSAEIDAQIARLLDEALGASNLSLRGLSEKSGVKLTRLGDILRRGRAITTGELQAVADALGLASWQIVRDAERVLNMPPAASSLDPVSVPDFTAMAAKNDGRDPREDHDQPMPDYE